MASTAITVQQGARQPIVVYTERPVPVPLAILGMFE